MQIFLTDGLAAELGKCVRGQFFCDFTAYMSSLLKLLFMSAQIIETMTFTQITVIWTPGRSFRTTIKMLYQQGESITVF